MALPKYARATRRFYFDAAHHLPNYPGKCCNIHGHRWTLDVTIEQRISDKTYFVIDFSEMKQKVQPLLDNLDHKDLNTLVEQPTAEALCMWIWAELKRIFDQSLIVIRLYESPDSWVEYTGGI